MVAVPTPPSSAGSPPPLDPTEHLSSGEVGAALYALSLPDIREMELLDSPREFQTDNGSVTGHPGDVAIITARKMDQYPIRSSIFYGTYEIIGRVGNRLVARRLIHVRKAWEVLSDTALLRLPVRDGRPPVTTVIEHGGWVYQSDDDDYGPISKEHKRRSHAEVGPIKKVKGVAWTRRFERLARFLTFLPPLLTLIALLGAMVLPKQARIPAILLETTLLFIGIGAYMWARMNRWELKAVVADQERLQLNERFQIAAELLGDHPSVDFPQMTLWRAAQSPHSRTVDYSDGNAKLLKRLLELVGSTIVEIKKKVTDARRAETISQILEVLSVLGIIACNVRLIWHPEELVEAAALWLPSAIGALHALGYHNRTADQLPLLGELSRQLDFVMRQLLKHANWSEQETQEHREAREATLRTLCKVVGQYSQAELRLAIKQHLALPG